VGNQPDKTIEKNLVGDYRGPLAKRIFDLTLACLGLVVISPGLLLLALLVRFKLGRPVLFRQVRPGHRGKLFTVYKFRSMNDWRDAQGNLLPDTQRLTRFGRLLRATSLDELPELFNILRGEMSLVGPRPLLVKYLDLYTPEQARRHDVLPGITGWAQINGRNALTWEEKFRLDVWYVDHWSLWLDIKILALSVWKVLKREGISQPGHATAKEFTGSPKTGSPGAEKTWSEEVTRFWQAFLQHNPHITPDTPYETWHFGDHRELANELYPLVLAGKKNATAGLVWECEFDGEALPQPGGFSVITDFDGHPQCIIQTTDVRVLPFDEVDTQFAADEGEGDLSLDYWRQAHWRAFSRSCTRIGRQPEPKMPVVCERFRLLFPIHLPDN
jgi:sugar transferase EpsL